MQEMLHLQNMQIMHTCKPNLPNQTYQTKHTKTNQSYQPNQNKPTKPNQFQPTKLSEPKPTKQHQNYWLKQSTPGSVVPQVMFTAYRPEIANITSACFFGWDVLVFLVIQINKKGWHRGCCKGEILSQSHFQKSKSRYVSLLKERPAGERTEAPVHKRLQEGTQFH